jgi:hypothetical protein
MSVENESPFMIGSRDLEKRIRLESAWVANWENRDLRQLLWHRHRMVQGRTRMMNQLQAVALNQGLRYKKRLWREAGTETTGSVLPIPLSPLLLHAVADGLPVSCLIET